MKLLPNLWNGTHFLITLLKLVYLACVPVCICLSQSNALYDSRGFFYRIDRYYQVRQDYSSLFELYWPSSVKDKYEKGVLSSIPKKDELEPQLILFQPGGYLMYCENFIFIFILLHTMSLVRTIYSSQSYGDRVKASVAMGVGYYV